MQQTREQKFAAAVFERISGVTGLAQAEKDKYGSMAHQLPVLIRTAGLAQALAFVDARREPVMQRLLDDLAIVLGRAPRADLIRLSRDAPLADYMRLTQDALAALLWFKRFAQSVLDVTPDQKVEP
ncbi:type III-B CRISPR module-associated protein Cmr5 [Oscillochloris sp. ZM17-4]|uniref:type III-B CRISPR module-associated protein Cmr5 n=1 Tax=Oscillochloris sp. ZM17-4 TaxID=2866714 RepID=UPI001C737FD7|nr:type III-B CRISPR module-associated protein Cmr5 [Oscillochloris sp. ZM17-4]MBX0331288.1 type III-B CRISPR module-associated protein Cmr5 [Oscillochloris sp. ZM17-4]